MRPLWPFSERWISGDFVFIIEPVLLVVLVLGLVMPSLFSLINEEVGARDKSGMPQGRLAAIVALISVFAFWGLCGYEHRRADRGAGVAKLSGSGCVAGFGLSEYVESVSLAWGD